MRHSRLHRGLKADLPSSLSYGEVYFCTDTLQVYLGLANNSVVEVRDKQVLQEISNIKGDITSKNNDLISKINALTTTVNNNKSDGDNKHNALAQTVADNKTAIDNKVNDLTGVVNANKSAIEHTVSELTGTVNANKTDANNKINALTGTVNANKSDADNKHNSLTQTVTDNRAYGERTYVKRADYLNGDIDFNNVTTPGMYYVIGGNHANKPPTLANGKGGMLIVSSYATNTKGIIQTFTDEVHGVTSTRVLPYGTSTWGSWNTHYSVNSKPTPNDLGAYTKNEVDTRDTNTLNSAKSYTNSEVAKKLSLTGGVMTGLLQTPNATMGIKLGDDSLIGDGNIANQMLLQGGEDSTQGGITFGSGKDTNIYRGDANLLKTDDTFNAVGGLQWNGQSLDNRYVKGNNIKLSVSNDVLNSSVLTTSNKQLLAGSSDRVYLGNSNTKLSILSSINPEIMIGTTSYNLYHTGNKPTPADIGASPSNHNHDSAYLGKTATATNSDKLFGYGRYLGQSQGGSFGIPVVGQDGVIEIGHFIDFHLPHSSKDFDARMNLSDDAQSILFNNKQMLLKGQAVPSDIGALPDVNGTSANTKSLNSLAWEVGTDPNKKITMGVGSSDVYIKNTHTQQYLQLRDDGKFAYNGNLVYHTGNKPTPSDIGALANSDVSSEYDANKVVRRNGVGDIQGRLFRANYQDESYMNGALAFRTNSNGDNYTRYCNNPIAVNDWLGSSTGRGRLDVGVDLNTITKNGVYELNEISKSPNGIQGLYDWGVLVVLNSTARMAQIYYPHQTQNNNGIPYIRVRNADIWTPWRPFTQGLNWNDVQGKPSTFPPSSHNHDGVYVKGSNIALSVSNDVLNSSALSTSRKQLIAGSIDKVYAGNTSAKLILETSETPQVRMGNDNYYPIYHTGNKPSPSDIGASPSNHNHDGSYLPLWGGTLTGEVSFNADNLGIDFFDGAKIYKKSADGLTLHSHSDDQGIRIEDASGNELMRVAKNRQLSFKGTNITLDDSNSVLWRGYHHMIKAETITPSKKLSQCLRGWVLVWSDWDDGVPGGNNFNINYSYIPKNTMFNTGTNTNFALSCGEYANGFANKTLYIFDDKITGHDSNKDKANNPNSYDIVIRAVLEF